VTKHYDFVVVGGRLSSVLAAALLTHRGLRGALVDQGELATTGSGAVDELLVSPSGSSVMDRVHQELGVKDDFARMARPLRPAVQVVLPEQRFDFVGGAQLEELARGMEVSVASIQRCFESMIEVDKSIGGYLAEVGELPPPSGFFTRRSATASARRVEALARPLEESEVARDPVIRELFAAWIPFLTFLDPKGAEEWTEARWVRPLARLLGGGFAAGSGTSDRDLLLDVGRRKSLDIRATAVERMLPEGRTWTVTLAGQREPVLADAVIDASSDLSGLDAIPTRNQGRQLPVQLQAARPRGALHAWGIELDEDAVPEPMGTHVLLLNGRRDPSRVDPEDPTGADRPIWVSSRPSEQAGRRQLILQHPMSTVQAHGGTRLDEVLKARLERLVPFLEDASPQTFQPREAGRFGTPCLAHPFFDPGLDSVTGLGGVSMRTPFKNLWLAGPCVIPGLGREGEYLSALQSANAVQQLLGGRTL
jgi:hypothetical protein